MYTLIWWYLRVLTVLHTPEVADIMPRLHLLRSSYDLVVYDFPYDLFDIVGGNMLRRLRLHCLQSPYDFFRRQPHINRTMPAR